MNLARILSSRKDIEKAIEQYRSIESIRPDYVPALMAIGFAYDGLGDKSKAEEYYRKVLRIVPKHIDAANNLAFILSEKQGMTDEALKYAGIAREQAPKNPHVLDTMGWVLYKKGNYRNALSEFEESLKLNPNNALVCFHYGMALYRNQEFERAREHFEKALEIDPKFIGADQARKMLR